MRHAEALALKAKRKLAVIIDEFSDLEKYNGLSVEKALRAEIQQQATIGYIFSGSEESVMLSMVRDRKRAFYKLGRIMELGPIQREAYILFIEKWLRKGAYEVDRDDLEKILDKGKQVPLNVQSLLGSIYDAARPMIQRLRCFRKLMFRRSGEISNGKNCPLRQGGPPRLKHPSPRHKGSGAPA
jgi:hypothetical protein